MNQLMRSMSTLMDATLLRAARVPSRPGSGPGPAGGDLELTLGRSFYLAVTALERVARARARPRAPAPPGDSLRA